ncbi:cytochrome oxidase [Natrinema sp. HArc-T2]|uniref:cytochrome oxidase n=1 Tax=Natrinema sp. HArc-T2 TaxID=3242701 RepID=UPI00359E3E6E
MDSRVSREIGHDEYDPWGTLALIALYFVALTLMWLFTYFVEFVGNDLTVFGTGVSVVLL